MEATSDAIVTLNPEALPEAERYEKTVFETLDKRGWSRPGKNVYYHRYLGERAFRAWLRKNGFHHFWNLDTSGYASGPHFDLRDANGYLATAGLIHLHSKLDHEIRLYQKLRARTAAELWVITRVVELRPSPRIELLGYLTRKMIGDRLDKADEDGKKYIDFTIPDLEPISKLASKLLPESVDPLEARMTSQREAALERMKKIEKGS